MELLTDFLTCFVAQTACQLFFQHSKPCMQTSHHQNIKTMQMGLQNTPFLGAALLTPTSLSSSSLLSIVTGLALALDLAKAADIDGCLASNSLNRKENAQNESDSSYNAFLLGVLTINFFFSASFYIYGVA